MYCLPLKNTLLFFLIHVLLFTFFAHYASSYLCFRWQTWDTFSETTHYPFFYQILLWKFFIFRTHCIYWTVNKTAQRGAPSLFLYIRIWLNGTVVTINKPKLTLFLTEVHILFINHTLNNSKMIAPTWIFECEHKIQDKEIKHFPFLDSVIH